MYDIVKVFAETEGSILKHTREAQRLSVQVRVGVQKYSSSTNTEFNLNDYYDKTTMVTAVGNIAYTGGTTNTGKDALDARFI